MEKLCRSLQQSGPSGFAPIALDHDFVKKLVDFLRPASTGCLPTQHFPANKPPAQLISQAAATRQVGIGRKDERFGRRHCSRSVADPLACGNSSRDQSSGDSAGDGDTGDSSDDGTETDSGDDVATEEAGLALQACRTLAVLPEGRRTLVSSGACPVLLAAVLRRLNGAVAAAAAAGPSLPPPAHTAPRAPCGPAPLPLGPPASSAARPVGATAATTATTATTTAAASSGPRDHRLEPQAASPPAKRRRLVVEAAMDAAPAAAAAAEGSDEVSPPLHAMMTTMAAMATGPVGVQGAAVVTTGAGDGSTPGAAALSDRQSRQELLLALRCSSLAGTLQLLVDLMLEEGEEKEVANPRVRGPRGPSVTSTALEEHADAGGGGEGGNCSGRDGAGRRSGWRQVGPQQAAEALPVLQQAWTAARVAAVAAGAAPVDWGQEAGSAIDTAAPPPPALVVQDLACLVMLLADVGGPGPLTASYAAAAGAGGDAAEPEAARLGGGIGRIISSHSGSSAEGAAGMCGLLRPDEWQLLLGRHWETRPLFLPLQHTTAAAAAPALTHVVRLDDDAHVGVGVGGDFPEQSQRRPGAQLQPLQPPPPHPAPELQPPAPWLLQRLQHHGRRADQAPDPPSVPFTSASSLVRCLLPSCCHCPLMDAAGRELLPYLRQARAAVLPHMVAHVDVDLVRGGAQRLVPAAAAAAVAEARGAGGAPPATERQQPQVEGRQQQEPAGSVPGVTAGDCEAALHAGFTVVLRAAGARCAWLCAVQDELEGLLGLPAGANMYCTPAGSQGLSAHYDDHCVLVLQLQGAKEWLLQPPRLLPEQLLPLSYCPRLPLPPLRAGSGPEAASIGLVSAPAGSAPSSPVPSSCRGEVAVVMLQPGDVMYLPRGWGHQAVAAAAAAVGGVRGPAAGAAWPGCRPAGGERGAASLHVTFGLEVEATFTWQAVVQCAVALAARGRMRRTEAEVLLHAWIVRTAFTAITGPLLALRKACPLAALLLPLPHNRPPPPPEAPRPDPATPAATSVALASPPTSHHSGCTAPRRGCTAVAVAEALLLNLQGCLEVEGGAEMPGRGMGLEVAALGAEGEVEGGERVLNGCAWLLDSGIPAAVPPEPLAAAGVQLLQVLHDRWQEEAGSGGGVWRRVLAQFTDQGGREEVGTLGSGGGGSSSSGGSGSTTVTEGQLATGPMVAAHAHCGPYDVSYWLEWTSGLLAAVPVCGPPCACAAAGAASTTTAVVVAGCSAGGGHGCAGERLLCDHGEGLAILSTDDECHRVARYLTSGAGGSGEAQTLGCSPHTISDGGGEAYSRGKAYKGGGVDDGDEVYGSIEAVQCLVPELLTAAAAEVAEALLLVASDQAACLDVRWRARHALLALHGGG